MFKKFFIIASLVLFSGSVKIWAKSPAETSSPEERSNGSLPDFPNSTITTFPPTTTTQPTPSNASQNQRLSPTGPGGIFPYQIDPVSVVLSASIIMAVHSYKETGKIDFAGIVQLLHSTDLYFGWLGSAAFGVVEQRFAQRVSNFGAYVKKRALGEIPPPEVGTVVKTAPMEQLTYTLGNIFAGLTYTVAVSSGYEYFSQAWKLATKEIPEAQSLGSIMHLPPERRTQLINNLFYVVAGDPSHAFINSVYNNRILTFEFLTTNIMMYVGYVGGTLIANRMGMENRFSRYATTVGASVLAGGLLQLVPDSTRNAVNSKLLDYKIRRQKAKVDNLSALIQKSVEEATYPPRTTPLVASLFDGINISSDLRHLKDDEDALLSLKMQKIYAERTLEQSTDQAFTSSLISSDTIKGHFDERVARLQLLSQTSAQLGVEKLQDKVQRWLIQGFDAKGIEDRSQIFVTSEKQRKERAEFYSNHLTKAIEDAQADQKDAADFHDFYDAMDRQAPQQSQEIREAIERVGVFGLRP